MNEEIKEKLRGQGKKVGEAYFRFKTAKADLARFDASTRVAVKADGVKRTEADMDAVVSIDPKRGPLERAAIVTEADKEAFDTDTKCLLAEAGLVSAEVSAMSRISQ